MVGTAPKYQKLQTEEDDEVENAQPTNEQPPSYEQSTGEGCSQQQAVLNTNVPMPTQDEEELHPAAKFQGAIPPPYNAVEKLPTYQEMQDWKKYEAQQEILNIYFPPDQVDPYSPNIDGIAIGDDCTFIFAFVLAFLFNWIGLCIGLCVMQMISTRYGALAGFGGSVIKWLLIVKYSSCCDNYSLDQQILAWFIPMFIGILFIVKGFVGWFQMRKLIKLTEEERASIRFKYFGLF